MAHLSWFLASAQPGRPVDSQKPAGRKMGSKNRVRREPAKPAAAGRETLAKNARETEDFLGTVEESREAHLLRHGGGRRDCGRCRYYLWGPAWVREYGSVEPPRSARHGPYAREAWVGERPARFHGAWALGCSFCAAWLTRLAGEPALRTGRARFNTRWARFEVRSSWLQASHIRQHAEDYEGHRIAAEAYFRPDAPAQVFL